MPKMILEALSPGEVDTIIEAAFTLLEKTGVNIHSEEALELLKNAGCKTDGVRVRIDRALLLKCFDSAPHCVKIYSRDGELAMELGGMNSYYGPGVTCPYVFDPHTGDRVEATKQFVRDVATVADALPHVDYLMSLCMVSDETPLFADLQDGMTGSIDLMVICDEWAAMSRFVKNGFVINDETLALDIIDKVGPGGAFITEEHTFEHFREAIYESEFIHRTNYETWVKKGSKTMQERAREKTLRLLQEHKPVPLSADRKEKIDSILMKYIKRKITFEGAH